MSGESKFGGELPLGCDALLDEPVALPANVLAFSHGRAALSWFIANRGPFSSAAISAYTCPTVPRHLEQERLQLGLFDHGSVDIARIATSLPGRTLVLLPATFGMCPWLDPQALADGLGERASVMIDAAQTAFGFDEYEIPSGGAVLCCPRKALALGDGGLLALEQVTDEEYKTVAALPEPIESCALKQEARRLFALDDILREDDALGLARKAEVQLPSGAHRMSSDSIEQFTRTDPDAHREKRRLNAKRLSERLSVVLESPIGAEGTPYNFPVLVKNRDAVLRRLHDRRLFATSLWPDTLHNENEHQVAARLARELIALPVDQRYQPSDMDSIADILLSCL